MKLHILAISRQNMRQGEKGMTLLEVLVSMLIIGIGLTVTVSMMIASNRYANSAADKSVAIQEIQSMVDAMRANRLGIEAYLNPNIASPTCAQTKLKDKLKCEGEKDAYARAKVEVAAWKQRLQQLFSGGNGEIKALDAKTNTYEISVSWQAGLENNRQNDDSKTSRPEAIGLAFTL